MNHLVIKLELCSYENSGWSRSWVEHTVCCVLPVYTMLVSQHKEGEGEGEGVRERGRGREWVERESFELAMKLTWAKGCQVFSTLE